MNPERWKIVSALLDELLDLAPQKRADRLAKLRCDDPSVGDEVESLLRQHSTSGFLATPPQILLDLIPATLITPSPGESGSSPGSAPPQAGRFHVEGEIARGGMGAVLRAFDPDIRRPLAIKVLLPEVRGDPGAERRFLREAQITGRLQHPGIPPIHEVGRLADGSPFFAMKLILGRTLADLIIARALPPGDGRGVGIFEQVCRTLAYAHSEGILHRDLKPANVMVGAFGEVQVMDWGLAKELHGRASAPAVATEAAQDGDLTRAGSVHGTPAFLAPEQARGETDQLDERCDVFGLGGILCALLTGRPPFSGPVQDVLQRSARGDLTEAAGLLAACGADARLVELARKCLAPAKADRYRDAREVAAAVTAYREEAQTQLRQAELAREKALVQAREERRRRRVTLALLAVLVVGSVTATSLWRLAEQRRGTAETAREDLQSERDRSELTARQARDAVRQSFILATEDPEFQKDGMQEARKRLIDRALAYFREFTKQRQDDPALREDLADAHARIADILSERGEQREALEQYTRTVELLDQSLREAPDSHEVQRLLAARLNAKANVERTLGRTGEAQKTLDRSFALCDQLSRAEPANPSFQGTLARAWSALGHLHADRGKHTDALRAYENARDIYQKLHGSGRRDVGLFAALANTLVSMGHVLQDLGRPQEAAPVYGSAARLREDLVAADPTPYHRSELARTCGSLALVQETLGQVEKALSAHKRVIELREALAGANPRVLDYRADLGTSYLNYADTLRADPGNSAESAKYRHKALEQFLALLKTAPNSIDYTHRAAAAHVAVAMSLRIDLKQTQQARQHLVAARSLWQKLEDAGTATPAHRFIAAQCEAQLALIHLYAGEYGEAIRAFEPANARLQRLIAAGCTPAACKYELSVNLNNVCYCQQESGRLDEALLAGLRVVELREDLVRSSPKTPAYEKALQRAKESMAGLGLLHVQKAAGKPASTSPADQLAFERARLAAWEKLARDYPKIAAFRTGVARTHYQLAVLEASSLADKADRRATIDRVLAALRRAKENGVHDVKQLESEPAFAPLRDRPEFRRLLDGSDQ